MTKKGERSVGAVRFGEGFVQEDKETKEDDKRSMGELDMKVVSTIRLILADEVMHDVMEEKSTTGIWLNLEKRYMSKSLMNKLNLKQNLYVLKMTKGADLRQHINIFKQIISNML